MITYELVKQLKEAGFVQRGNGWGLFEGGGVINCNFIGDGTNAIYVPTLSELIEACGDETVVVKYWTSQIGGGMRVANAECNGTCEVGSTPEEAVAKLWIALNKK
jgi:hypothetical protein